MTHAPAISTQAVPAVLTGHGAENLRPVNPCDDCAWDREVGILPGASFFHGAAWASVLAETYGHLPLYLQVDSSSGLQGLLPLMEVASPLTGRRGVALPFADMSPLIARDADVARRLLESAKALGRERGWRYLELRGIPDTLSELQLTSGYVAHHLDLRAGPEVLVNSMHPSARRAARKAQESGIHIEVGGSPAAMRSYFELHCQTRKRHGLPPQSWRFFENLWQRAISGGRGFVAIARWSGEPAAGAVFLHSARHVVFKYGASDSAFLPMRPNNELFRKVIQECAEKGFETLHLGASSTKNLGLCRFKRSLGALESPLHYVRHYFKRARWVACPDHSESAVNSILRCFPIGLLRRIGGLMYRHLSVLAAMSSGSLPGWTGVTS